MSDVTPITKDEFVAWTKDPVTKVVLNMLEQLNQSHMTAWANKNYVGENEYQGQVLEAEARGRIQAYSFLHNGIKSKALIKFKEEE